MAIPGIPNNFYLQQGNRVNQLSWDLVPGATSYNVQRSIDGVSFGTVASPTASNYTDTNVIIGTQYWYQIASVNVSGTSPFTSIQSIVPAPTSELSLGELRLRAQERADRVNSQFVTVSEWNFFINQSMTELYDLLINVYEDLFLAPRVRIVSNGSSFIYPLPDGAITFLDINNQPFVPPPFYRLMGVDLSLNTAQNAFVTVNKYNLIDRNKSVYPNTASTIYGVFNLQYRLLGSNIEFIPTPSAGQALQLLYAPRLPQLLKDNDITTIGYSGWLQYVIVRAAKYALDKEESDTSKLDDELGFLKQRIEESAINRDIGQADKISDVRQNSNWGGGNGFGFSGQNGGW